MKRILIIIGILFVVLVAYSSKKENETQKPNLLIIHTDEHNFRTLGCYRKTLEPDQTFMWGKENIVETPNIDLLAEKGALCTSFYATTPVCSPSRGAFISGRYPQSNGVQSNNMKLNDDIKTFASILQENGYATGYAGKWHLDGDGKPQWAPERKFGFEDNTNMYNRGHYKKVGDTPNGPEIIPRNEKGEGTYDVDNADDKSFMTDFLTNKTIDFIKNNKNNPFCYMVSIPDPHGPNTVRAPYDTMYNHMEFETPRTALKDTVGLPDWSQKKKNFINQNGMSKYFGMVKCIDDNVGRIIGFLKKENLLENTIVIFTADHGDLLGEHARDDKFVTYEASMKIPFVMYYEGKVKQGKIINEALSCVDFQPTILSLMGVQAGGKEEGRNVSSLFTSETQIKDWKDVVFLRGSGYDGNHAISTWIAVVTDRYKLVYSTKEGNSPWLYDLEKDPDELINYYSNSEYKSIAKDLAQELHNYCVTYKEPRFEIPFVKKELEKKIKN